MSGKLEIGRASGGLHAPPPLRVAALLWGLPEPEPDGIRRAATNVDDLGRLHAEGHPALVAWLEAAVEPLSAAVTTVENLFDPQAVILGGAMPDSILDHLVASVRLPDRSVANREGRHAPRLLRGASGRMTATLGAAALVIDQAFTPRIAVQP